jgi:oxygen-dependent protoporphyrinogen oxidase
VTEPLDTLVVGAGMSGLAHAFWRRQAGRRVRLLEATDRVGGVIRTDDVDGFRVERAARSIPSSATHVTALAEALPDGPRLLPASDAAKAQFLLRAKGLVQVPRSPPAFLSSDLLSMGAKVRAFSEVLRPARRVTGGPPETLLRPFTSGIYGASPDRLGAADAFPQLTALEQRRGSVIRGLIAKGREARARRGGARRKREVLMVEGGMQRLPEGIARALGDDVQLESPIDCVAPAGDGMACVITRTGERIVAREVVLAVPAWVQAAMLSEHFPEHAEALDAVPYVPITVVAVGFPKDRGPTLPDAFGFLRAPDAKARILGATFFSKLTPDAAPEGQELVDVFVGGSEDPEGAALRDEDLRYTVLRDLGHALGGTIRPTLFDVHRWRRAIPLFAPGHRGRMAALQAALAGSGIRLLGSHATGVSVDHCCAPAAPLGPLPEGVVRA